MTTFSERPSGVALRAVATCLLTVLGAYFVIQGALMTIAPPWFFEYVGPYGEANSHYIRDNGAMSLAIGIGALLTIVRPQARQLMLIVITVQFWLHTVSHLIDVGNAEPYLYGPVELVLLVLTAIALAAVSALYPRSFQPSNASIEQGV
ncbi:DUF4345 family protein [Mycolicibacterium farcinogenes]|uniref:Uncharacterized protein n=1 Tax=Mycolicibacterium farcinogenes TaxID=1802 RepID=A0ACD1FQY1_MYCFR|nr:DUF4345 family protein [Mycolicibacterium farcinogenes]QZH69448.1 hypothetical protein K6L26_30405 [Mycolicibacterium farcinogenes]